MLQYSSAAQAQTLFNICKADAINKLQDFVGIESLVVPALRQWLSQVSFALKATFINPADSIQQDLLSEVGRWYGDLRVQIYETRWAGATEWERNEAVKAALRALKKFAMGDTMKVQLFSSRSDWSHLSLRIFVSIEKPAEIVPSCAGLFFKGMLSDSPVSPAAEPPRGLAFRGTDITTTRATK